jgi:hypothetical protein
MSGILYHIAGQATPPNGDQLAEHGLGSVLEVGDIDTAIVESGGLGAGAIVTRSESMGEYRPRYRPDEQTWQTFGAVSVGFYTAARPTPRSLARPKSIRGWKHSLGDGQEWVVPQLRKVDEGEVSVVTPARMVWDGSAWQRGSVIERFASIDGVVSEYLEQWRSAYDQTPVGGVFDGIDYPGVIESAVAVLSANYYVGNREASVLGLFTEHDEAQGVLQVAASIPLLAAWIAHKAEAGVKQKKTLGESGSTTGDGEAA